MTPTRELALQTTKEYEKFTKLFNLRCVAVYGGTGISEQIVCFYVYSCCFSYLDTVFQAELKRGAELILCTPVRMIDMLAANSGMQRIYFVDL